MDQEDLDIKFRRTETSFEPSYQLRKAWQKCVDPFTSCTKFLDTLISFVPVIGWLPKYNIRQCLLSDVIAGFTTGIMHIPQGIAYAALSGVDPVYGLYSSFFPPLFYMIFGSSRHCSIGSFAVIALMSGIANDQVMSKYGASFTEDAQNITSTVDGLEITPIQVASTLTFALGILQLIAGLLRLEFLTTYFSDQLVAGYTTGSAVHVLLAQIDDILGIKVPKVSGPGYLFRRIYDLIVRLPQTNVFTLIVSGISMLFLFIGKDYVNPFVNKFLPFKLPIPFEIILIVLAAGLSYAFSFNAVYGTSIVGTVPGGMPTPQWPVFRILPDCLWSILGVAVVSIAVHISMAKMLAKKLKYDIDSGREFYALGFASTLSGFFPVYPTGTALGRTMVNVESGAKTQLSNLFSCLLLLVSILWLGPLLKTLPSCVLASIILMALRSMLNRLSELKQLWPISKVDFYIWLFSFSVTVAIDVMEGLALSILFALLTVIFRFQWPRVRQLTSLSEKNISNNISNSSSWLKKASEDSGVYIYRFEAPLIFTNVEFFKKSVSKVYDEWATMKDRGESKVIKKNCRWFIIDCSCMPFVDCMGVNALREAVAEARNCNAQVLFVAANSNVWESLQAMNFFAVVSRDSFLPTVKEALRVANERKSTEQEDEDEDEESEDVSPHCNGLLQIQIDSSDPVMSQALILPHSNNKD